MKRKITSFLATLLLMLIALPASAQLDELKLKTVSINYEPAATMTPDTQWYLVWNKRVYTTEGGGYWEDKGAGQRAYMSAGTGVIEDGNFATDRAQYLVRFISTQEEGKYQIQFGTGNFMCITSNQPYTTANASSAAFFNVYNIGGNNGHFGVNVWNMGARIDQDGSGATMSTWGNGEITTTDGNNDFTIYPVTLEQSSEIEAAYSRLNDCFSIYEQYLPGWGTSTFDHGTGIGQYNYSDEDYNFFVTNLQLALDIIEEKVVDVTVEMIDEVIQNIEDGYAAIIESFVPLTIANGNYRIVSALEWTNTERIQTGYDENDQPVYEEKTTHPLKAMYATMEGKAMWASIDSTDCRYLWQMTNVGNSTDSVLIQMMNIATDGIMDACSQSSQATLSADSKTKMYLQFSQRRADGKIVVVMKPSTGGGYAFLHCNQHGSGTGTASNIVGWDASSGASQWILEPVSDEEVQELVEAYAPIKNHELLVSMFQDLIAETEAAIAQAKDETYITERSEGLITDPAQFSSPYSETREGSSFKNVLNADESTFWHSDWSSSVANHTHYFQVECAAPIKGALQCFMRRRNVQTDHITKLGVFGTNDASKTGRLGDDECEVTTEDGWTNLGTFTLPNASASQTAYSNSVDIPESYKYFRFYIDGTTGGRGYGHFAQFQLYQLTVDGNTQWSKLGKVADNIERALANAKKVDMDELTIEDYNALKDTLDTFKPLLVDLSALAAAIDANKNMAELVVEGDAPGFWSAGSETSEFAATLKEAKDYIKGGVYTQDEIDAYTKFITSTAKDIFAAANPVEEGQWYALKFDSEENYDAHGWNKAGAINKTLGDLWNNYAAPANVVTDGEGESQTTSLEGFSYLNEVTVGQSVRFIDDETIGEMDQIAFRFVAQGDTAFVIQHKSGLYLSGASRSTNLTLGLTPALFNVRAVGYGKVIIEARNLKGQGYYEEPVYLHAQNAGHSLVTWNNDNVASSSALYIEPIAENEFSEGPEVAQGGAYMKVKDNSMVFMCYPTAFSVEDADIYAYEGAIPADVAVADLAHYAFNKVEQAEPGQPVLLVVGNIEEFTPDNPDEEEEEEPTMIQIIPVGTSFAPDALTVNGAHGTYTYQWVDEGTVVVGGGEIARAGNTLVLAEGAENTDCTRDISANTGYIVYGEKVLTNASADDFDFVITAPRGPEIAAKGDVNGDNAIDIADVVKVLSFMAESATASEHPEADVNGDNAIDIADVVKVLSIMAQQ